MNIREDDIFEGDEEFGVFLSELEPSTCSYVGDDYDDYAAVITIQDIDCEYLFNGAFSDSNIIFQWHQ